MPKGADRDTMIGPFTVDVNVYLTDGERVAIAKCNMPVGDAPKAEEILKLVGEAVEQSASAGKFVPMGRNEFENTILSERTGAQINFATKEDWDAVPADTEVLKDALRWCSVSGDFQSGGQARAGWLKVVAPLLYTAEELKGLAA